MFQLVCMKDVLRIDPSDFDKDRIQALTNEIHKRFANKVRSNSLWIPLASIRWWAREKNSAPLYRVRAHYRSMVGAPAAAAAAAAIISQSRASFLTAHA